MCLGVHFDKKFTWTQHIKLKLNSRLRTLNYFFNSQSKLSPHTKRDLYEILLKPIWTYGTRNETFRDKDPHLHLKQNERVR